MPTSKRGPGRPRIHESTAARVSAHRKAHSDKGARVEVFLSPSASWRLKRLAEVWGLSRSAAMERLILGADKQYEDILFPETDKE